MKQVGATVFVVMSETGVVPMEDHENCEKGSDSFLPMEGHENCERRAASFAPLENQPQFLKLLREAKKKLVIQPQPPESPYVSVASFKKPLVFYTSQDHMVRFLLQDSIQYADKEGNVETSGIKIKLIPEKDFFWCFRWVRNMLDDLPRRMGIPSQSNVPLHGLVLHSDTFGNLAELYIKTADGSGLFALEMEWVDIDHILFLGDRFSRDMLRNQLHDKILNVEFAFEIRELVLEKPCHQHEMRASIRPVLTHLRIIDREGHATSRFPFARSIKAPVKQWKKPKPRYYLEERTEQFRNLQVALVRKRDEQIRNIRSGLVRKEAGGGKASRNQLFSFPPTLKNLCG